MGSVSLIYFDRSLICLNFDERDNPSVVQSAFQCNLQQYPTVGRLRPEVTAAMSHSL